MRLFIRISTQWRTDSKGMVGLDYNVIFPLLEIYDIKDKEHVFEGIRTMELAVLDKYLKG